MQGDLPDTHFIAVVRSFINALFYYFCSAFIDFCFMHNKHIQTAAD